MKEQFLKENEFNFELLDDITYKLKQVKYNICEHTKNDNEDIWEYGGNKWESDGNHEEWYISPFKKCKKCGLKIKISDKEYNSRNSN